MKRTNYAGKIRIVDIGKKVTLCGWVQRIRNLGSLVFVDLRDREGLMQIVFDDTVNKNIYDKAVNLSREYVIEVEGEIRKRQSVNPNMATGEVEMIANKLNLISKAKTPPILIDEKDTAKEDLRLKYRYLELRKKSLMDKLRFRSKMYNVLRNYLYNEGFIEFETPILTKSTPEGARDYLVPSRVNKSKFYGLPQSPQLLKQLLMIGGADKYFQIARCFRDEDLRADRQPEFTQLDIEMSFVDQEDILSFNEKMMKELFYNMKGLKLETPFKRMSYKEALNDYGTDKPDTRFENKLINLDDIFKNTDFKIFKDILSLGGTVRGIFFEGDNIFSKKKIKNIEKLSKVYGAKGLAHIIISDAIDGSISKFLNDEEIKNIREITNNKNGYLFIVSGDKKNVLTVLGNLRTYLAKELNLYDENEYNFLWVVDFISFSYNEEIQKYQAEHHPFTNIKQSSLEAFKNKDYSNIYSEAYDLVLNGYEIAGGSVRIHDEQLQREVFELLELSEEDINSKFGFFVEALKYGTPPHAGIAYGLDRLTMLLTNTNNIKDVIAFPKTLNASCLMSETPSSVSKEQLDELGIMVKKVESDS